MTPLNRSSDSPWASYARSFESVIRRPLRAANDALRAAPRRWSVGRGARIASPEEQQAALALRIETAAALLAQTSVAGPIHDSDRAFALLEDALTTTTFPHGAAAWLSLVAVHGEYPDERSVDRLARALRMEGAVRAVDDVRRIVSERAADGPGTCARLRVVTDRVVVDVTHTAKVQMHTGIQRVVRETVTRWLESGRPVELASFNSRANALKPLRGAAAARLVDWRAHVANEAPRRKEPTDRDDDVLVPWQSVLIVPEVIFDHARLEAYRALGVARVLESLSLIGFDLVPMTAAETTKEGLSETFARYLAVVKHSDRVSAISRSSARDFAAFGEMVEAQGLEAPVVRPQGLPVDRPLVSDESLAAWRALLGEAGAPTVLAVGSHEPRKNHLAVLEAAERLWSTGASFQLVMIGGESWDAEEFEALAGALRARGRPIEIVGECSEETLWAAYALARFSVFPSLLEGFGLPIAESLASGTPVVTSDYGSMAEIADGGGCLLVDPRDPEGLAAAMRRLLDDEELLARLRDEARARPVRTWDDYADEVWQFLVEGGS